ncbi:MAG TPA: aldo/keto reductase [Dehalococcoidia bacterium]|nr:aldo/keto reductase [Dehalococcoidia bacterium]
MNYREIGNTGVRVSEIGFGTGDNAGLMVKATPEDMERTVARALELGINYFDCSPDYGKGVAETNLGRILKKLGAHPVITTKIEIGPQNKEDIPGRVLQSIDESLARLQVDHVDFLEIHNAPAARHNPRTEDVVRNQGAHSFGPPWIPLVLEDYIGEKGALGALDRLQSGGKVRFFGFACEHAESEAAKRLLDTGRFHIINVWLNLMNPTSGWPKPAGLSVDYDYGQVIDYAAAHGAGVAVIRPLAGGATTGASGRHALAGGGMSRNPEPFLAEQRRASPLGFLAKRDRSLAAAAYQFILSHPGVSTVVGGYSELAHMEEAVSCSGRGPLTSDEMRRVHEVWEADFKIPASRT